MAYEEDISLKPGPNADTEDEVRKHIDSSVLDLYDVYSYRHAAAIMKTSFPDELKEIEETLLAFKITISDIAMPGGNESVIPKQFSSTLRPHNWYETRVQGDLVIRVSEQGEEVLPSGKFKKHKLPEKPEIVVENYIDGHKIDYVKGRVALDVEWNSKDQTYDRDLYAFRMFHECGIISVASIITRSEKLNPVFEVTRLLKKDGTTDLDKDGNPKLCKQKYGASTTWMGKLLYRLNTGRHGGCPVLVFGIRPDIITDWQNN
ncbi:BglII/BstYI family type II restriction endonuclease [Thiolapillus sp.]|uniref:BglII/BstYI family type II restriction endonuclease n=1 Tax=Thiolapillus sp. TaxID=2017437 RepID=UPI0025EE1D28|nr:BglII/BstYI family type II restriction endonuclease [Thiolapillus sp.]